jgi:hypothetical protein
MCVRYAPQVSPLRFAHCLVTDAACTERDCSGLLSPSSLVTAPVNTRYRVALPTLSRSLVSDGPRLSGVSGLDEWPWCRLSVCLSSITGVVIHEDI